MSSVDGDILSVCANCGKGEEASDKLKACTACKLVKYCNRECQIAHRPQHKKKCRRRAAVLYDEKLFKQPPPEEDCPICFLLLPTLHMGKRYKACCGKVICSGCSHAPLYDDQGNEVDNEKCAFCRVPVPKTDEGMIERLIKRVDAGNAEAMFYLGIYYDQGQHGLPQNMAKALELWHRAVELGYARAYNSICYAYSRYSFVDKKKATRYFELAAIGGSVNARHNLGDDEEDAGNFDRALKHFLIAVRSGDSDSLERIKELYSNGHATKEDYTQALRSYQEYLGEIKSPQRDKAAATHDDCRYY